MSSSSEESISSMSSSGEYDELFGGADFSGVILEDFLMKCCEMSWVFCFEDWRERLSFRAF